MMNFIKKGFAKIKMSTFCLKYLNYNLTFRNRDFEEDYSQSKFSQQRAILLMISAFAIIFSTITWIVNPLNRPNSEPDFYAYRTALVVFIIIFNLIQRFKPVYGSLMLFFLSLICFVSLGETSKKNMENSIVSMIISTSMYMEILILILIMARIGIIKIFIFISGVNFLCFFRYVPFHENYDSKYYPLIHFVFNTILLSCLSYAIERIDRKRFYLDKRKEFSLTCFKELVKDVFPNPIAIVQGDKLLFSNKEALKIFKCQDKDEIFSQFDKVYIDSNPNDLHSEVHTSLINHYEVKNEDTILFSKAELKKQGSNEEDNTLRFKKKQTLLDFLKKNDEPSSNFSYIKVLRGSLNDSESSNSVHYYDIKVKNLIWEDKFANLVIFSENEAFQEIKLLKEQSEYKDSLLATVSHDLRTPLNGIIGMISESIQLITEINIKKNLTVAYRSALYLLSMINDILDYHQITNEKLKLNFEYFCLWSLIQDVSKLIKFQAKLKGLTFLKENKIAGPNKKAFIRSDPNRLKQVILNLLGNALKFTPAGSITITLEEIEQTIEQDYSCGSYMIKVTDTGIGIKKEDQSMLFTLFGKLDSSRKEYNKSGVGLGLVISQTIVKILNNNMKKGDIEVQSNLGEGSCFYFPVVSRIEKGYEENFSSYINEPGINEIYRNTENSMTLENEDLDHLLKENKNIRILLVDDDQINIIVASSYLNSLKTIKYDVANNGLQAVEKIKSKAEKKEYYNILLMDCNMPIMNGFEATKKIREMVEQEYIPDMYIIACTANASKSDLEYCHSVGMNDCITKPFSKRDLISKFKKYLQSII